MHFYCKQTKFGLGFILFFFLFQHGLKAQTVHAHFPFGISPAIYHTIEEILLPSIPGKEFSKLVDPEYTKPTFFAYNFNINLPVPSVTTKWKNYSPAYKTFQIKLKSKGAQGLGLVLEHVKLGQGEELFVYNLNGISGAFDDKNIPKSGILPLDFASGDNLVIEWNIPTKNTRQGSFVIKTIAHAYKPIIKGLKVNNKKNNSQDAGCYICFDNPDFQRNKRGVVKIITYLETGTKLCTGSLVNNTAKDMAPYILTAQHCISNQAEADRSVFIFSQDITDCSTPQNLDELPINGATFMASAYETDFSLVKLRTSPPAYMLPYFLGWDITDQDLDHVSTVHRPHGNRKQVSIYNGLVSKSNYTDDPKRMEDGFWLVPRWNAGITEAGSSGAPLFNKKNAIIGSLTGGSATCKAPFNDYFERLSVSWMAFPEPGRQLKYWLDPLNTGAKEIAGLDPFKSQHLSCDSIANVENKDITGLENYPKGGYYTGINYDSITTYAEKFFSKDSIMLTTTTLNIALINTAAEGGIMVSVNKSNMNKPGDALYQMYIPYHNLVLGKNTFSINSELYVKDTFFISYSANYSSGANFAIAQTSWADNHPNTAYVKLPSGWKPFNEISPLQNGASLDISTSYCHFVPQSNVDNKNTNLVAYPNPTNSSLIIKGKDSAINFQKAYLYDVRGIKQPASFQLINQDIILDVHYLRPGVYILKIIYSNQIYEVKFIKT